MAALFATTFVYGRLSADNESTAIKAAGVPASPAGLLAPAALLGAGLGAAATGLLCFVVPAANLQVEQALWSNLAEFAASEINRKSRIPLQGVGGELSVFASRAEVPDKSRRLAAVADAPPGALGSARPGDVQVVRLLDAYVVRYAADADDHTQIADEVFAAASATVYIAPPSYARAGGGAFDVAAALGESVLESDEFALTVVLDGGVTLPRRLAVANRHAGTGPRPTVAAARATQVGPVYRRSPLRVNNPKFMDVAELRLLLREPERGRRVRDEVRRLAREDQTLALLDRLRDAAATPAGATLTEPGPGGSTFTLTSDGPGRRIAATLHYDGVAVSLAQTRPLAGGGGERVVVRTTDLRVRAEPLAGEPPRALYTFAFPDAAVSIDGDAARENRAVERRAAVTMPDDLAGLADVGAADLLAGRGGDPLRPVEAAGLLELLGRQRAEVRGELHARAAFIAACAGLPLIGGALGLTFKSGNFLGAFAVSLAPAAVCVIAATAGQKAVEAVPYVTPADVAALRPPRPHALAPLAVWSGDLAVAAAGGILLWRVRQR